MEAGCALGNLVADAPASCLGSYHRWVSLAVGVCMQLCAGTLYSVTAWGVPLKEAAGWGTDEALNLAETCGTLGVYVAIHNGLLPTLPSGAALLFTGWNSLAHVAANGGSPGAAALALYLVGQGSVTSFLCSLAPNVGNFGARDQGKVHGLLLSGFGGSSALFASVYRAEYAADLPAFYRLTGGVTCGAALAGALLLKDGSGAKEAGARAGAGDETEGKRLIGTSTPNSSSSSGDGGGGGFADVATLELGAVSSSAGRERGARGGAHEATSLSAPEDVKRESEEEEEEEAIVNASGGAGAGGNAGGRGANAGAALCGCADVRANFSDLLRRPLFWVVYLHLAITMGTALLWVNQAGSFTAAAVGTKDHLSTMVVLFSLGNVGGRLAAGAASDVVEARLGQPRSVFLTLGAVLMAISLATLAASPDARAGHSHAYVNHSYTGQVQEEGGGDGADAAADLYLDPSAGRAARLVSALGVGVAEGTIMSAWTAIVRTFFGAHRFGMNLAVYNSAIALGSAAFNGLAAAATATATGTGDGDEDEGGAGAGGDSSRGYNAVEGYRAVFVASSVACAGAAVLGVLLTRMLGRESSSNNDDDQDDSAVTSGEGRYQQDRRRAGLG